MENDHTIFQGSSGTVPTNSSSVPPQQITPLPQAPPPNPGFAAPVNPPIVNSTIQKPPDSPKKGLVFPSGILKILIGLVVVVVIILIVTLVIIPLFSNKTNGPVKLTYWGLWEDEKTMQSVISDFERANPNITVNYSKQDIKQYRETLVTRINNGTGPDIFTYHNAWYPMLSSVLLPFPSSTIPKQDYINSFYPVAQRDLIRNGAIYGVPMEMDTMAMYYNTDLLKSAGITPPKTWNDFIDDARTLTVKDESGKIQTAGAALGTFDNITHAPDILSLLFLQNSVDLNNINSSANRVNETFSFYTSFALDQNNVWDNTLDPSLLAFSKGNLAMFFGYSWDYFTIKAFNPNLNFAITGVPQLPNQEANLASYWVTGVSVKTAHQAQALLFMQYLSRKDTEEKLYAAESKGRAFGEPYARVDLADTVKNNPLIYPFLSQAKTAQSSLFVDSTNDNGLNQQLNTYLGNAVNAVDNGTSPESAFTTFSQGVSQVLQKYAQ